MALQQDERSQRLARRPCGRSISAGRSSLYHKGSLCKFVLLISLPIMYLYVSLSFLLCIFILYQPTSSQAEEELSACDHFKRIFPTPTSHHYFQYFPQATKTLRSPTEINHHQSSNIKVSYYDKLLDACEHVAVKRGRAPLIREVFSH